MSYLRNSWYAAAWDSEVVGTAMLSRTLLDEPVLLFRNLDGEIRALRDQCPHRFVPLSMGKRCGATIQCGYHGLEFDEYGKCIRNPHGAGRIPPAVRVRSYTVSERHSLIWIWMGEADRADPALIPDFSFLDREKFAVGQGYLHARANYLLEVDNIMDLSHIEFLHSTSLGSPGISASDPVVERDGNDLWTRRFVTNHILSDFLYQANGIPPGTPVDRWIDVRWSAAANMKLNVGVTLAGRTRQEGEMNDQCHLFTPETNTTTHYWYGIGFPRTMGERATRLTELRIAAMRKVFESEDLPMVEAQQRLMGGKEFWDMKPTLLISDGAGVKARRLLAQMIESEGGNSPTASSDGFAPARGAGEESAPL